MSETILSVKDLTINFKTDNGLVQAVRSVSFDLKKGETLCIVGESGSGKSVTSKAIMGILANNAVIENGSIIYRGENLLEVSEEEFHKIRGHKIGMIFQDPLSSLNPIVRIGKQITEATLINSNKLKLMYDDLISDDLIAYKNTIARRDIQLKNELKNLNKFIQDCKEKLNSENISKEEKERIHQEIKNYKTSYQQFVQKIKNDTLEKLKPLKENLKKSQRLAKEKVKQYKKTALSERDQGIKELNQQLSKATNQDEKKKIKLKKQQIKKDCTDKLRITKFEAKRRALEIMREVGIPQPEKRFKQYPFEFSGGMRQRVALIRTLATNPDILLLDEPFSALDYQTRINVSEDIFKMIKDSNVSAILVTHDISEAIAMADRVIVLSHRPAKLKKIIDIKTESPDNTPFNKRLSSEFRKYFDEIWGLLNE